MEVAAQTTTVDCVSSLELCQFLAWGGKQSSPLGSYNSHQIGCSLSRLVVSQGIEADSLEITLGKCAPFFTCPQSWLRFAA